MREKGINTLELIIVILIIGIIGLFLVNLISSTFSVYENTLSESESFANVNMIMDKLARDIRQGKIVESISPYTLSIRLSTDDRVYTYSLVIGEDNKKYFAVNGTILAGPIKDLIFTGLDSNMNYTTSTSQIRMIAYTLTTIEGRKLASTIGLRAEFKPILGKIVISEILYNIPSNSPPGQAKRYHFIELRNLSSQPIDLNGWRINVNGTYYSISSSFTLAPLGFGVIGGGNLPSVPAPWYSSVQLDISGDTNTIIIYDNYNNIVDSITYTYGWGGQYTTGAWFSMERISYTRPTQEQSNWTNSKNSIGTFREGNTTYTIYATPGFTNSVSE
ncbi:MAG: lamin tail domain-containing protein [Dictyoglomus sp.]